MSTLEATVAEPVATSPALSPRAAWVNLTTVSGAHAVIHAYAVLLPLVYPILQAEYHLNFTEVGLLITIPNLVGGLIQVVFGYLGRYVSRKAMIGVGNIVVGVSMFLTGVSASYAGFLGWGVLRNIGSGPQHPVGSALLTDSFERKRHGFALAGHVAGGNLGTLLVPSVGTALILGIGWQHTLMLFAVPGLVAGLAVILFAHEPSARIRPRSAPTRARVAARRSSTAPLPASVAAAPSGATGMRMPTLPRADRVRAAVAPLRHRGVLLIVLASIVAAGGRGVGILTTYHSISTTPSGSISISSPRSTRSCSSAAWPGHWRRAASLTGSAGAHCC